MMSKFVNDMPCPMCALSYGVTPQTYIRTRPGSIVANGSLRRVIVLWMTIRAGLSVPRGCATVMAGISASTAMDLGIAILAPIQRVGGRRTIGVVPHEVAKA
jgi:hypothetical protein